MYKVFDIQVNKLSEWLIPTMMRKGVMMAFVKAAFAPIVTLHNSFLGYRDAKFYQIRMNYQTCYLESFLNDRFDYVQRRIYIEDAETVEQVYLYQVEEEKPEWLYQQSENEPLYLFTEGESLGDLLNDFVVYVPADIQFSESEIRAMLSTKLSGKRYKIETF